MNRSEVREVAELYFQRFNAELQRGLAEVRGETQKSITELGARLDTSIAELRTEMASQRADLIKWMFLFWAGTVLPLAGLAVALVKL